MLRQSGNAPRYSLLLMSECTTRSDGWTSCSLYCLKPSYSPPAVALCLHLRGETVMINALSAGISGKEPGVSAEVFHSHCSDSVTQYLYCGGATLKNNCIKIENHNGLAFCHVCYCAAWDRLSWCLFALSIVWNVLLFLSVFFKSSAAFLVHQGLWYIKKCLKEGY